MPNQRITSGVMASGGMLRTIWMVESSRVAQTRSEPVSRPSSKPIAPPTASPLRARAALMRTCSQSSPVRPSFQAAMATSLGAGSTRAASQPSDALICQRDSSASGTSQGSRRWPVARSAPARPGDRPGALLCGSPAVAAPETGGIDMVVRIQRCRVLGAATLATTSPIGPNGEPPRRRAWSSTGNSGKTSSAKR